MKPRSQYATYTPALITELKMLVVNLPRADGVKAVAKRLKLSDRQARSVYATYIDVPEVVVPVKSSKIKSVVEKPVARALRRLFWDIETSPNIVLSWNVGYKINLSHDSILKERAIICIGYKWEGEKEAHVLRWDDSQDDKEMLTKFLEIANEADELVHHNGDQFDLPWFKTRCLFHGLEPLPQYKCADTLQWARRKFYFNSNKLDYIAQYLGFGAKLKTGFGLWKEIVINKSEKALDDMCTYCARDVELLERVWKKLSTSVTPKTHAGVLGGKDKWTDPRDGSTNVKVSKTRVSAGGTVQYQMVNLDTGSYFTISETAHKAYLEAKGK